MNIKSFIRVFKEVIIDMCEPFRFNRFQLIQKTGTADAKQSYAQTIYCKSPGKPQGRQ